MQIKSYTYKVFIGNECIKRLLTHNKRRFAQKLGTLKWRGLKKKQGSVYLKISYGRRLDNFNKLVDFFNDGEYTSKKDFMLAFRSFTE